MNRLATRLLLAMLAVVLLALAVIPLSQTIATRRTFNALEADFRERVLEGRPPRRPPPDKQVDANKGLNQNEDRDAPPFLREENERLFELFATYRQAQQRAVLAGSVVALCLAVALALWLTRSIAKPIEAVSRAASGLAKGDLTTRVTTDQSYSSEAQNLAENFNAMAASLQTYEGERKAMIADIAHELRTPLATMQLRIDALSDGLVTFSEDEAKLLQGQVSLLARLIDDLRVLSLADAGRLSLNMQDVELNQFIEITLQQFQPRANAAKVTLEFIPSPQSIVVNADPDRLAQILNNLLDNALRVTPESGSIRVGLGASVTQAQLSVRDTGPGIPEEELATIFERFVQGKYRDVQGSHDRWGKKGSGLGLAIVKTLVTLHGGSVVAKNYGGGATLEVTLPRTTRGMSAQSQD
jgi:two-component system, OmpR family, sensor histidine kinase BaeS